MIAKKLDRMRQLQWSVFAYSCIEAMAGTKQEFTADSITFMCGYPDKNHSPNSVNGLIGGMFAKASRAGIIERCGYAISASPTRKGGRLQVWKGV